MGVVLTYLHDYITSDVLCLLWLEFEGILTTASGPARALMQSWPIHCVMHLSYDNIVYHRDALILVMPVCVDA